MRGVGVVERRGDGRRRGQSRVRTRQADRRVVVRVYGRRQRDPGQRLVDRLIDRLVDRLRRRRRERRRKMRRRIKGGEMIGFGDLRHHVRRHRVRRHDVAGHGMMRRLVGGTARAYFTPVIDWI